MNAKYKTAALALVGALTASFAGGTAAATFILPTVANSPGIVTESLYKDATGALRPALMVDGIPIAFKYDDFWSYSGHILTSIQNQNPTWFPTSTFGTYDFATGTGTILVNLSSVAGGATNPFGLQDPVNLGGGGDNVTGWVCEWGGDPQWCQQWGTTNGANRQYSNAASVEGTTSTVGEMLAGLQSINPEWKIPLFYTDYNQTGGGDSLFMSAQVRIINPTTGGTVAFWDLDSLTNTQWDQVAPTYNFGDITFTNEANCTSIGPWNPLTGTGCAGVTTSGKTYTGSHNIGSGKADFMAFAPDMDLTLFNPNHLFVVTINLGCNPSGVPDGLGTTDQGCNTNGYEEFGILGGIGGNRIVPEPGSIALIGLGLAAAGFVGRRRRQA